MRDHIIKFARILKNASLVDLLLVITGLILFGFSLDTSETNVEKVNVDIIRPKWE
jgi:hypothetical protein